MQQNVRTEKTAHIISHIHWDREWYLPFRFFQAQLPEFFSALFALLTKRKTQTFVLDGATIMIEDWQAELAKQGKQGKEYLQQLRALVQEGRVLVGPYYVQLDWYLASGETLVRNLLIGTQDAEELGRVMNIGWLMDNFGLPAQTAQIHKQCGIHALFIWRGICAKKRHCELQMIGSNGDELLVMYMRDSYRNAMQLMAAGTEKRIHSACSSLLPHSQSQQFLLMNGYDHDLYVEDLSSVIGTSVANMSVRQSTPESYVDDVSKSLADKETESIRGEHICGWDVAVFPGIHSSRVPLKQQSAYCEYLIQRIVEPLAALAGKQENFTCFWKELLQNHPHDSISGVSVDPVHCAMRDNFTKLEKRLHEQIQHIAASIIDSTGVYLFNPSPFIRKELVEIPEKLECPEGKRTSKHYQVSIPPLAIVPLNDQTKAQSSLEPLVIQQTKREVSNAFIRLTIAEDGSLSIYDRSTGIAYTRQHIFHDSADAGDCYNYSPCKNDSLITTEGKQAKITFLTESPQLVRICIQQTLLVPESVENDGRSSSRTELPIVSYVTLSQNSPIVSFESHIRNRARDHRLSLRVGTQATSDVHYAGAPFEAICRKNGRRAVQPDTTASSLSVTAREVEDYGDYPFEGWIAPGGDTGLLCMARGLREYQSYENGDVAIHLFRSVGWIAQGNLISRSGDAGPEILVPDAWLLEDMRFEYALCPFSQSWQERYKEIDAYLNPLYIFHSDHSDKQEKHPAARSNQHKDNPLGKQLLSIENSSKDTENTPVFLSACKYPEQNAKRQENNTAHTNKTGTLIVRVYNPCEISTKVAITSSFPIVHAATTNLTEQNIEQLNPAQTLGITLKAKEIKSLILTLDRDKSGDGTETSYSAENYTVTRLALQSSVPAMLKQYALPPAYTQNLLDKELANMQSIKQELDAIEKNADETTELARCLLEQKRTLLERSLLEKELSVLLIRHRLEHQDDCIALTVIESKLHALGETLNRARINKRVADFQVLMAED